VRQRRRGSLAKLAANQDAYIGKRVTTSGVVHAQADMQRSRYYVLADRADDLVLLVPKRLARRYSGDQVSVTGQFGVDARAGRFIRIERIKTTG
jgi:hypothetical protein